MGKQRKTLSAFSLFSGSTLAMAFSLLSVIGLLLWWQSLINRQLEAQYQYLATQLKPGNRIAAPLRLLVQQQDEKLARELFPTGNETVAPDNAPGSIANRLANRKKMVLYERTFFVLLLLSGHLFFLYIYFRERVRRRVTEETILMATHELRQPLQSLSLALESLQPAARGRSRKAIETGLTDINRLGQHVRWLAGTFAGTEPSGQSLTELNLTTWTREMLAEEFNERETSRIALDLPDRTVVIRIAQPLFHFLVRNLTENALKYSQSVVHISAHLKRRKLVLRIGSEGAAIRSADFRRMGNLFFRPADAGVQNKTGFGLGLYLCGRVARRSGGRLALENDGPLTLAELVLRTL